MMMRLRLRWLSSLWRHTGSIPPRADMQQPTYCTCGFTRSYDRPTRSIVPERVMSDPPKEKTFA
jgi:hypothetical protein